MSDLTACIDKLVTDKTFSLEGVEAIKALRDRAVILERQLERVTDQANSFEKANMEQARMIGALGTELAALKGAKARELAVFNIEKAGAVAEARAQELGRCFDTVFRNTVFRETANRQVVPNMGANGCSTYPISVPESVERTTDPK